MSLAAGVFTLPRARAQDSSAADKAAIIAVIEQQYDAFNRDDQEAAFALATPSIRLMFGAADNFMQSVRQNYAPVYRHRSVEFGDLRDGFHQIVTLTGTDGRHWLALYSMQKSADGDWRISGCNLIEDPDQHV